MKPPTGARGSLPRRGAALTAIFAASLTLAVSAATGASPALASAASPAWTISSISAPTIFAPRSTGDLYILTVTNSGAAVANGGASPITVTDDLPEGLTATAIGGLDQFQRNTPTCTLATLTCSYSAAIGAGAMFRVYVTVSVGADPPSGISNLATVAGGGAPSASTSEDTTIGSTPAGFGVESFTASADNADGSLDTQAGDHPYSATATFFLNTVFQPGSAGLIEPSQNLKDVTVGLPPGFIGDPTAVPQCPRFGECPTDSQVGEATVFFVSGAPLNVPFELGPSITRVPVYNLAPQNGEPADFEFDIRNALAHIEGRVVRGAGGYGVVTMSSDVPEAVPFMGVSVTFWGVPGDPSHDALRGLQCSNELCEQPLPTPFGSAVKPFLTNPTSCGPPLMTTLSVDSWQSPGAFASPPPAVSPAPTGCERLTFNPSISLTPDTTQAEAPTGLAVSLRLPQTDTPNTLATSHLKDVTVTLPLGMSASPSAADGLEGCSDAQIALSSTNPGSCPGASQIATAQVHTPLLDHPLPGTVYLGTPLCAPCTDADAESGRMLRLFIEVDDPKSGVVVKLPGTVSADPQTGRLTASFKDNPQLPFDDLELRFKSGPRAPLATPPACGSYTIASDLSPWSSPFIPDALLSGTFSISSGCGGGFAPSFTAGTTVPNAGGYSPFTLTLTRADGEQDLSQMQVRLPPGLLAMLSSVPRCVEPQAALGNCPPASRIGTTTVAAGPGSHPLYLSAPVYLTGPYGGAPFGLSVAVPAVAGPFNLGTVVVRAAITIDPRTSAVTVTSGALPQIIDGVPVRLRVVNVLINRPGFLLNPTNCSPQAIDATIASAEGAAATRSSPFAVGGCASLPFHPTFTLSTQARTSKALGASLDVKVAQRPGEAGIRKVDVSLPLALPSRLTTLQKACTEGQFAANPAGCPAGSDVGIAIARTPLLNAPLSGPAYLVSHGGLAFPDLVVVLQGEGVAIDLVGNTDIKKGVTSSHFAAVPDAPISSFELYLPEGPHSLLAAHVPAKANGSLCATRILMPTTIVGQNGAQKTQRTPLRVTGCKKAAKQRRKTRTAPPHGTGRRHR